MQRSGGSLARRGLRPPAKLILNLRGVDRVTPVVAGTILDIGNKPPPRTDPGIRAKLIEHIADRRHHVDVRPLIASANVIGFARFPLSSASDPLAMVET